MGLLQLQYFKALAERGHLTKTANELMISGPSLSASIARLEEEIGCKLFDREGRNIRLNQCGEIYLKYTNDILSMLENAKAEVLEVSGQQKMSLSIAISSPIIWLDAFKAFINQYPDITVSHTLIKRDKFKDFSFCAKFDFIITATMDMLHSDWDYETLIQDDYPVIAVYKGHPFAKRKTITLIETKEEKYISVNKDFSMRKFFEDSCRMSGFQPKIVIECDYMLRSAMLAAGNGIVFTTMSGAYGKTLNDAIYIPVKNYPIRRTQGIFFNKRSYLSKTAKLFRDFMVEYHQNLNFNW